MKEITLTVNTSFHDSSLHHKEDPSVRKTQARLFEAKEQGHYLVALRMDMHIGPPVRVHPHHFDAQTGFIKWSDASLLPTHFTLAVAEGIGRQTPADASLKAQIATQRFALSRHHDPLVLATTGIPISDLTAAFRNALQVEDSQEESDQKGTGSTLAAAHIRLVGNRYYAHMGNIGLSMIVVLDATGKIKYQSGTTTCTVESLTQHQLPLEPQDLVIALTYGAWKRFINAASLQTSSNASTAKIQLPSDALQPFAKHPFLTHINTQLASTLLQQSEAENISHKAIRKKIIDFLITHLKTVNKKAIKDFLTHALFFDDCSNYEETAEMRVKLPGKLSKDYALTTPDTLVQLWEDYSSYLYTSKPHPVHRDIYFCSYNTRAFLKTFFNTDYTVKNLLDLLSGDQYDEIRKTILTALENTERPGGNTLYNMPEKNQMPLSYFLDHFFIQHQSDCASIMIFKTPDYKIELIRAWLEAEKNDTVVIRALLLKLMMKEKITSKDLARAITTLSNEVYTQASYAEQGISLVPNTILATIPHYMALNERIVKSQIAEYISAITHLWKLPEPITGQAFNFQTRMTTYTSPINEFIEICSALAEQYPELTSVAIQEAVVYFEKQVWPQLQGEIARCIQQSGTEKEQISCRKQIVRVLAQAKNTSPFILSSPNTTTWAHATLNNRTDLQIKLDETIQKLEKESPTFGNNLTSTLGGFFGS